jgi:hypothetical protein
MKTEAVTRLLLSSDGIDGKEDNTEGSISKVH